MLDTCDRCGTPLVVGDWPFCPHARKSRRLCVITPATDDSDTGDHFTFTITDLPIGFRVPPNGEPHTS